MRRWLILYLGLAACLLAGGVLAEDDEWFVVWIGGGVRPEAVTSSGEVVIMNGAGEVVQTVTTVNVANPFVRPCTEAAISPDGRHRAFYVGAATGGTLYLMDGRGDPVALDGVHHLACLGMGSFAWRGDSAAFAYIDYHTTGDIAHGTLNIRAADDPANLLYSRDDVAAFHLDGDDLHLLTVFRDSVRVEIGTVDHGLEEVARIYSEREDCPFRAGDLRRINADTLAVLLGQNCRGGNAWALYTVETASRTANRVLREGASSFTSQAATLRLITTSSGDTVHLLHPDGRLGNYSAFLQTVDLRQMSDRLSGDIPPDTQYIITPRLPAATMSAAPALSPDRRHIALVQQTADNVSQIYMIDRRERDAITQVSGGGRGDLISATAFTSDSRMLFYVAGGIDGDANAIMALDVGGRDPQERLRGAFITPLVLSPDGERAIILQQTTGGANNIPYSDLVRVDLDGGGEPVIVYEGADFDDSGLSTRREFAMPLFWLPR